jgi:ABC-type phosphate transport system substrate-binding protein
MKMKPGLRTAAAAAAVLCGLAASIPTAHADPQQYTAPLFGFGSDTTQDVTNAFAGFSAGVNYTPLQTATGKRQLVSWDAFPANQCITTKVGSPVIQRPNGSTNGRRILSRAYGGGLWPSAANACGQRDVSGMVDFARSSAGPSGSGTDLVYIPFGRDALSWAYNKPSGSPVTNLTIAELDSLFTNGPANISGTVIIPCGIQTGSGTYASWNTAVGVTAGEEAVGTAFCNSLLGVPDAGGRLQESNGPELTLKANLLATTNNAICDGVSGGPAVSCANAQVIVGFSAAQFIARSNNVASPNPGAGVEIGQIGGAAFVNGTGSSRTPNSAGYANATFGRDVYNVLPAETVNDLGNSPIQEMFVGSTSVICSATTTIETFGFLSLGASCGSTTLTGPFVS